jgi:hypothetical protein
MPWLAARGRPADPCVGARIEAARRRGTILSIAFLTIRSNSQPLDGPGPGWHVKGFSRLFALSLFIGMVAAVQIAEGLVRWYIHREDRAHLMVLREELIDVGAEMIQAQLDADRLRERIDRSHASAPRYPLRLAGQDGAVRSHADSRAAAVRIRERNRQLDELNDLVVRRNSAAMRYHVLADSIRTIADRAREPYFAIPLPAEAAVQRGVTTVMVPWEGLGAGALPETRVVQRPFRGAGMP